MLVAVLSLKGSPGVTTFGVALAARWPQAVLVEADPAGGDIAMRFSLAAVPGLVSLAAAARGGGDHTLLMRHTQVLPGDVPVVSAPPDADRARAALVSLAADEVSYGALRQAATVLGTTVIADCGRIDTGSPAMPLVRAADAMLVVTGSRADELAHLARRLPEIGRWSSRPALLLAGRGHSIADVARELRVTPIGRIPWDPKGAAVLTGQQAVLRWYRSGPQRSALGQTAHDVAIYLQAWTDTGRVGSPGGARVPADAARSGTSRARLSGLRGGRSGQQGEVS